MSKWFVGFLVLVGATGAAVAGYWAVHASRETFSYRTMPVEIGRFEAAISATGTLVPEESIDVGAQVSGQIVNMGYDPRFEATLAHDMLSRGLFGVPMIACQIPTKWINYSSPVESGTVLAQLDSSQFQNDVDEKQATLDRTNAELTLAQAKYEKAEDDWHRAQTLYQGKAISVEDYKLARLNYKLAHGEIERCQKVVEEARAALARAEKNLDFATIRSPARGVIIERRVNVGQTVQSSFNAPSLFLLGTDLKRLQIWASVNEADISQIYEGQDVAFTVEASGDLFFGKVALIRLNAAMTMNVVTYPVVVSIDNSDSKLRPYQTANVRFLLTQKQKTMLVPNSALRWRPSRNHVAPDFLKEFEQMYKQRRSTVLERLQEREKPERHAWIVADAAGRVRPVRVIAGLSDGTMTEVLGGDLKEGMEVIVGEEAREETRANPFTPVRGKKD
jgi:HlyD family secretion protein